MPDRPANGKSTRRGAHSLLLCAGAIALTWLVVLPRVGEIDGVRQHIQRMEQAGIEVDAMFYTELNWQPPAGAVYRPGSQASDVPSADVSRR